MVDARRHDTSPAKATRARGRTGFFVPMVKDFWKDLAALGCNLSEIGYFTMISTSKATSPIGSLYMRHEWADLDGTNLDHAERTLEQLEKRGLIARDGYYILVVAWIRQYAFNNPKYLRAGLYPLQNEIDSPFLRFVFGTQLLQLRLCDLDKTKAANLHESASLLWAEITGSALPPADAMDGDIDQPNDYMVTALSNMPGIELAVTELDRRTWCVVQAELHRPLQQALGKHRKVTQIQPRASNH